MNSEKVAKRISFSIHDVWLCAILMTTFAIIAFINLGDINYPSSAYYGKQDEPVIIDFGHTVDISTIAYLCGEKPFEGFAVYVPDSENNWELRHIENVDKNVFRWQIIAANMTTRYLIIVPTTPGLVLLEMAFFRNNQIIETKDYDQTGVALFDEQNLVPDAPFFTNSTYFDENLHAVTAHAFIHGLKAYEWSHPPLGKSIISIGINMFGMTPFGWRFMGVLFGVIMIAPLYALGRLLFNKRFSAFIAAFILTFDFMHFVQARIAHLDVFLVTFIIFMYLFMYEYIQISPENRTSRKALSCLAFSGLFMGLAISVKWQGVYAGLGLAVLFALEWYDAYVYYSSRKRKGLFYKDFARTVKWCLLFFVIVPATIYCLSYIPFSRAFGLSWPDGIIQNQTNMFNWHAYQDDIHEFQSSWWTWLFNMRPVLYYSFVNHDTGNYGAISTFGNPAVWWAGLLALIWCIKRWVADKDHVARFLCIAWLAQILPWAFISRSSFIYHYFPCVPFLALMIAHFMNTRTVHRQRQYALAFCLLVLVMFISFYPVIACLPVSADYIARLEWLPNWEFIAAELLR